MLAIVATLALAPLVTVLQERTDLAGLIALVRGGAEGERWLGEAGDPAVRQRYGVSANAGLNEAAQVIFRTILEKNPGSKRKGLDYSLTVLASSEVNALALPGGKIYLMSGATNLPGIKTDEIAWLLSHELAHTNRAHGFRQLRDSLLINQGVRMLGKDEQLAKVATLIGSFINAQHSQKDELEADRIGFGYLQAAGFDTAAGLALMRRLQTLEARKDWFDQLFATHPRSAERSRRLKHLHFEQRYGDSYRTLVAASTNLKPGVISAYDWSDPRWIKDYESETGWKVYNLDNYYARPNDQGKGQCTWLVQALRSDEIPRGPTGSNSAHAWPERCRASGYAVGSKPKLGAVACWNKSVNGTGHVALVTRLLGGNLIEVWDANWPTDSKIRRRVIDLSQERHLTGFIYWPDGRSETPPELLSAAGKPREILLLDQPVYLGDDEHGAKVLWDRFFALGGSDLARRSRAHIRLRLKAVPSKDPIISINETEVGRIIAEGDSWQTYRTPNFPLSTLRAGENLIDIETVVLDARRSFDDCWIDDVYLVIE